MLSVWSGRTLRLLTVSALLLACLTGVEPYAPTSAAVPSGQPTLVPVWRMDLAAEPDVIMLTSDTLILGHSRTLEGRDARTGTRLWTWGKEAIDEEKAAHAMWSTGRVASVMYTEDADDDYDDDDYGDYKAATIYTFDTRTGERLWSLESGFSGGPDYIDLVGLVAGRAYLVMPGRGEVHALDAETGVLLWRAAVGEGCVPEPVTPGEELLVLLETCGERGTLRTFDAATGEPRWSAPPPTDVTELSARHGVVMAAGDYELVLFDSLGRELYRRPVVEAPETAIGEEVLAMQHHERERLTGPPEVELIDLETGRVGGVHHISGYLYEADRLYFETAVPGPPDGSFLYTIERADEPPRLVGHLTPWSTLLDAGYGMVLINEKTDDSDSAELILYEIRQVPGLSPHEVARGGVPARNWPDPCALLPATLGGRRYTKTPYGAPTALGLRTPVRCYATSGDGPDITLDVVWVYPDPERAVEHMNEMTERLSLKRLRGLPGAAAHDPFAEDLILFHAGPAVFHVYVDGDPDLARRLVRHVSQRFGEGRT